MGEPCFQEENIIYFSLYWCNQVHTIFGRTISRKWPYLCSQMESKNCAFWHTEAFYFIFLINRYIYFSPMGNEKLPIKKKKENSLWFFFLLLLCFAMSVINWMHFFLFLLKQSCDSREEGGYCPVFVRYWFTEGWSWVSCSTLPSGKIDSWQSVCSMITLENYDSFYWWTLRRKLNAYLVSCSALYTFHSQHGETIQKFSHLQGCLLRLIATMIQLLVV